MYFHGMILLRNKVLIWLSSKKFNEAYNLISSIILYTL